MQEGSRQGVKCFVCKGVGLLAGLMLLGSFAYATPIVDLSSSDFHASTVSAVASTLHNGAQTAGGSARDSGFASFYTLGAATSVSPSTCTLSGDCRATTKVPEPQSLMLVGSGLLSLAGFLRRRFLAR
jgi:hypothetical protein